MQARSAQVDLNAPPSCAEACAQAKTCGSDQAQNQCVQACKQDPQGAMQRCAMLSACQAFTACQAQAQTQTTQAVDGTSLVRDCAAQCQSLAQCQQARGCEAQRFAALSVPGCEAPSLEQEQEECQSACELSGRPCAAQASCEALEACAENHLQRHRTELAAATPPASALQADPNCHALCDRALRCGIEASGASSQEQDRLAHSLPAALLDSQTECLMQCQAEYKSERRADFEHCLGQSHCSDFIECANEL